MDVLLAVEDSGTVEVHPASLEFWNSLVSAWKEDNTGLGKLSSFVLYSFFAQTTSLGIRLFLGF